MAERKRHLKANFSL